ncbi:MAG: NUDIX domain-containing protein [Candidatus Diapherotrites archaeon]|nr:NUDIX domain-containing protein [Candidatus Diapherotrites archaeon]
MPDISREIIDIVNSKDEIIGKSTLREAHEKGLLHRAVHVWVFNPKGELLMVKRSKNMFIAPLHWGGAMGEHLKAGEDYESAAIRGLREELEIRKPKLKKLVKKKLIDGGKGKYCNSEFVQLFKCKHNGKMKFSRMEIADGGFYSIDEIRKAVKSESMPFASMFLDFFDWYMKNKKGK